jgi:hypothetical protein
MTDENSQRPIPITRIYVAVAGTIQVPAHGSTLTVRKFPLRTIVQPIGRQVAQVAHVVTKLRLMTMKQYNIPASDITFEPITTIVLQARDSAEMVHVYRLLFRRRLNPVLFSDDNPEYGPGSWPTALAVFANKKQVNGILDYLPLWGSHGGS